MKKVLLIITLLVIVIASNSYNYLTVERGSAYNYKTLEVMYDSKKRPHKIVIYKALNTSYNRISIAAIDLDAGTYINK